MKSILSCAFAFIAFGGIAQEVPITSIKKIKFSASAGIARSTFDFNVPSPSKFAAPEFRLGLRVTKPISKVFEVKSGLSFGVKVKREAYNKTDSAGSFVVVTPPMFMNTDELASKRNHYFLEIPLLLQIHFDHPALGFRTGLNTRFWQPNNSDVDLLTARPELGAMAGAFFRINRKVDVGVDYYYGITKIDYSSYAIDSSPPSDFIMRNRFLQLTVDYTFSK